MPCASEKIVVKLSRGLRGVPPSVVEDLFFERELEEVRVDRDNTLPVGVVRMFLPARYRGQEEDLSRALTETVEEWVKNILPVTWEKNPIQVVAEVTTTKKNFPRFAGTGVSARKNGHTPKRSPRRFGAGRGARC